MGWVHRGGPWISGPCFVYVLLYLSFYVYRSITTTPTGGDRPIITTSAKKIVYEGIRFCNKDLQKGTESANQPAKETITCPTLCLKAIEALTIIFLRFSFSECGKERLRCFGTVRGHKNGSGETYRPGVNSSL